MILAEIKFSCPHCEQHLETDESYCGQTVPCPSCKGDIAMPEGPKPQARVAGIASVPSEQSVEPESNAEPLLTLRPVFIPWATVLSVLLLALFFYDKITEISLRRGIIQREYGLGTVFLATPATGFQQGRATSGIRVRDIADPDKVYATVQALVGKTGFFAGSAIEFACR